MLADRLWPPAIVTCPRLVRPALLEPASMIGDGKGQISIKGYRDAYDWANAANMRRADLNSSNYENDNPGFAVYASEAWAHRAALSDRPVTVLPTVSCSFDCQLKLFIVIRCLSGTSRRRGFLNSQNTLGLSLLSLGGRRLKQKPYQLAASCIQSRCMRVQHFDSA